MLSSKTDPPESLHIAKVGSSVNCLGRDRGRDGGRDGENKITFLIILTIILLSRAGI